MVFIVVFDVQRMLYITIIHVIILYSVHCTPVIIYGLLYLLFKLYIFYCRLTAVECLIDSHLYILYCMMLLSVYCVLFNVLHLLFSNCCIECVVRCMLLLLNVV